MSTGERTVNGRSAATPRQPRAGRAAGMMLVPAVLLFGCIAAYVVAHGGAMEETALRSALPYLIAVSHSLSFVALLVVLRSEGRRLGDIGWRLPGGTGSALREVAIGIVAALLLYLFKELVLDSARALIEGNTPTFTTLFRFRPEASEMPLMVVASTFVLVEESVYRGYGLAALWSRWRPGPALLTMALLFGALHAGNGALAFLFTGILGTGLAALFLWRQSLLAPFVAHALYNVLVVLT